MECKYGTCGICAFCIHKMAYKPCVWRTLSEIPNSFGFFVWEVSESKTKVDPYLGMLEASNGGSITAWCSHFHTRERAERFLYSDPGYRQELIIIPEKKDV